MITTILSIILTLFACLVLAYISMATMIGPWIAPTLVLIAGLIFRIKRTTSHVNEKLTLIQTAGSVGGIVATAVGFTLPTLYFLDKPQFDTLLASPWLFCLFVGSLCFAGGSLGIFMGKAFAKKFLANKDMKFPVSQLIYRTITSQTQSNQAKQLLAGFSVSSIFCFLRDGFKFGRFFSIPNIIPTRKIILFSSLLQDKFQIMLMPMLWAIGFIAGMGIAFPLLVGMLSKYFVLYPIHNHAAYLPFELFPVLDPKQFAMAFCSGLILASFLPGLMKYPNILLRGFKHHSGVSYLSRFKSPGGIWKKVTTAPAQFLKNIEAVSAITISIVVFSALKFPIFAQLLILPLVVVSAYNISHIGIKIGLVQIGRFTTFVMIPTILLFKLNALQITALCVFVSAAIVTTADILFDYKIGELCSVDMKKINKYQWLGVAVTALGLGFLLWLLFSNLQLGTAELFAQRGRARALLIQSFDFNWTVLLFGLLYGLILKRLRVNPAMVFGGVLMPNGLTIGLVIGALGTLFVKKSDEQLPFFSGIFAAESLWLVVSILTKMI